jgi:hypothetical protein
MKISLGPFTLIRTRDLQEHKENMALLCEHVELLKERLRLEREVEKSKRRLEAIETVKLLDQHSESRWVN